jgi:hypothetical protein
MNLARLALAALCASAPLGAVTNPAFLPTLRSIEDGMPRYQEVEATSIELPATAISLGASAKAYQCWNLQLTSERGKRLLEMMTRLRSLQDSLAELRASLSRDISRFTVSPALDPALEQRISSEHDALAALFETFSELAEKGKKEGLLRKAPRGVFRDHAALVPIIKNDDYTMAYDTSSPECRTRNPGR